MGRKRTVTSRHAQLNVLSLDRPQAETATPFVVCYLALTLQKVTTEIVMSARAYSISKRLTYILKVMPYNRVIFRWFESLLFSMASHDLLRYRIVVPIVPILNVLARKRVVFWWHLVPERTFITTVALSLDKERTDVWPVSFVVWVCPCELLQHLLAC
jgi:hypothetical protein